ncbi:MAG: ATP-binding protein, partial [bacterium]
ISEINRMIWFAGGLGFILIIIVGFIISNSLTVRLNKMAGTARRFATGDFAIKIKSISKDELGDLSVALNRMAEDLQSYIMQLKQERDQLEAILNSMVEGVMVTDLSGNIVLSNHSFQNIFNLPAPINKRSITEVFRDAHLLEAIESAMAQKEDRFETIELVSPFRKSLEAHIAILGSKENSLGTVVVFHDVTQLAHLEKVRRDFVANVSHELRTPLTAIKGYAETVLENGTLPQNKAKEFLKTILRHTNRMSKLVVDLLTLSKLESVDSEDYLLDTNLSQIIFRVVDNFKNEIDKSKVELNLNVPENLPKVKGVVSEIETALENLLDNAFKYGSKGKEISISVKESQSEVQVEVTDQGMGIPVEHQPRIFERFYRVDKGRSRELGGTGLGLSIVKHIVQRHSGRIWVESEVGKGTTFSFTLPKAKKH